MALASCGAPAQKRWARLHIVSPAFRRVALARSQTPWTPPTMPPIVMPTLPPYQPPTLPPMPTPAPPQALLRRSESVAKRLRIGVSQFVRSAHARALIVLGVWRGKASRTLAIARPPRLSCASSARQSLGLLVGRPDSEEPARCMPADSHSVEAGQATRLQCTRSAPLLLPELSSNLSFKGIAALSNACGLTRPRPLNCLVLVSLGLVRAPPKSWARQVHASFPIVLPLSAIMCIGVAAVVSGACSFTNPVVCNSADIIITAEPVTLHKQRHILVVAAAEYGTPLSAESLQATMASGGS